MTRYQKAVEFMKAFLSFENAQHAKPNQLTPNQEQRRYDWLLEGFGDIYFVLSQIDPEDEEFSPLVTKANFHSNYLNWNQKTKEDLRAESIRNAQIDY